MADAPVSPTLTDPVAAAGSAFIGGPLGRFARPARGPRAVLVILAIGSVVFALGVLRTAPCLANGWVDPDRYEHLCYSDIPVLYTLRGLADGMVPYLEWPATGQPVEYPVLTGLLMYVGAAITAVLPSGADPTVYYLATMALQLGLFMLLLVAVSLTVRRRPWDGLLVALAPSVLLAATINWDMLAIALTAGSMLAWSRRRPVLSGVLLGLGVAAKFYPLLLLGPLLVLAWRRRRLVDAARATAAAAVTWLVVNVPVALAEPTGWGYFFDYSAVRGADFGSFWLALSHLGLGVDADLINILALLAFLILCLGIAALILLARVPPRFASVAFLVVAAFLVTNKVYSPQFVLWLLPLAVLARPRWRDFLVWQAAEVAYFVAIWWYLVGLTEPNTGLAEQQYAVATLIHIAGTCYLAAVVVRDVLLPAHDPVRVDGAPPDLLFDDPGGGVFDGAPFRAAWRPSPGVPGRTAGTTDGATGR